MANVDIKKNIGEIKAGESHRKYKVSDFGETLAGLAIAWACVAACAGGCVYICNYFRDYKKSTAKQEQVSASLVRNKQIEFQR